MSGPCSPWANVEETQTDKAVPGAADVDAEVLATMLTISSQVLYRATARLFPGLCSDTVRPRRMPETGRPDWWRWINGWGHECAYGNDRQRISLGAYPIRTISEVRVDGAVLAPSAYQVEDRRWLRRIDGPLWNMTQNLDADPLVDDNTLQVAFLWGQAPDESGVHACKVFGTELALAATGKACALPERIQSLTRDGATLALLDPFEFLDKGLTGVFVVDLFITSVNPDRQRRRAQVISPDFPRPVTRVNVTPGS